MYKIRPTKPAIEVASTASRQLGVLKMYTIVVFLYILATQILFVCSVWNTWYIIVLFYTCNGVIHTAHITRCFITIKCKQ